MVTQTTALNFVKNALGVADDYDVFDREIWGAAAAALSELNQIWTSIPFEDYNPERVFHEWLPRVEGRFEAARYIVTKTRLRFDPPGNAFLVTALQKEAEEIAWRLEVAGQRHTKTGEDRWKN